MPCFYPLHGFRSRHSNYSMVDGVSVPTGKRSVVYSRAQGFTDQPMSVPCGVCDGCRLAKAAEWTVRACHELTCHKEAIFLTLTFADIHMPDPPLVAVEDMQKFIKHVRQDFGPIRYLGCGEYGSKTLRPHYHFLIFGWRPSNCVKLAVRDTGPVFTSEDLYHVWPYGLHEFGAVTPASAGYVARYTTKKRFQFGDVGEEKLVQSRVPPLGIPWLETHYSEVYPDDSVRLGGKFYRPPRAYDKWLEANHPSLFRKVHAQRVDFALDPCSILNGDSFRLPIREGVLQGRIRGLTRGL